MVYLNYTKNAQLAHRKVYKGAYEENLDKCYEYIKAGRLSNDALLWYQAFEGFTLLGNYQLKDRPLAAELRRYVFEKKLDGKEELLKETGGNGKEIRKTVFRTGDGKTYNSLTDDELINRMVAVIQKSYKEKNIDEDENALEIHVKPNIIKKRFLIGGQAERRPLIRCAFALSMNREDFHRILCRNAFFRDLTTEVPGELIILYCLENEIMNWSVVVSLQKYAKDCLSKADIQGYSPTGTVYTDDARDISILHDMDMERFKQTLLKQSCLAARYKKDEDEKQYSASAFDMLVNHSILKALDDKSANNRATGKEKTVFLTDTILRYNDCFPMDKFSFPKLMPGMVMSADSYFRFLNYRIAFPSTNNARSRRIYSMEHGALPGAISENILSYSEIIKGLTQAHRIDRNDLLVVLFYYYIMDRWNRGQPFIAVNMSSAKRLWKNFLGFTNEKLLEVGYESLTLKNPLDAMLRISMISANPLECYNRIHELNVFSSLARDCYTRKKYPDTEHIDGSLKALDASYLTLKELNMVSDERYGDIERFVHDVENAYN